MTTTILEGFIMVIIYGVPAVLAITLHEAAHGFAALQKGDPTAKQKGRLSLNPFRHVDLMGTFVLPALLIFVKSPFIFGYAKPVPVHFGNLRHPKRDMIYVALAGPFINIVLAILSAALLHTVAFLPEIMMPTISQMLIFSININVLLAIFNMLPLPPLDGGRVMVGLLPKALARPFAKLERWGFVIIMGTFILLPYILSQSGISFSPFEVLIKMPMTWTMNTILVLVGL